MKITFQIKVVFFLLLFLSTLVQPKYAFSNNKNSYDLQAGVSVLNFGYKEFTTNDDMLDREDGYIPGFTVAVARNWENWTANITIVYHNGIVDYNGQTNNGTPVTSTTDTKISDYSFSLNHWISINTNKRFAIYTGYGQHRWQRTIKPTVTGTGTPVSGLNEQYNWDYLLLGTKLELHKNLTHHWIIDFQYNHMIDANMKVDFSGFDPVTLSLGAEWGLRFSSPYQLKIDNQLFIKLEPYYEYWEISRSETKRLRINGVETNISAVEPRSETQNIGFNLSLIKKF